MSSSSAAPGSTLSPFTPWVLLASATLAAAAPTLLAHHTSPSPTFYNQALALGLWALWVLVSQWGGRRLGSARSALTGTATDTGTGGRNAGLLALMCALALMTGAVLWSWGPGGLPSSLALSALAMLGAAALLVSAGAASGAASGAEVGAAARAQGRAGLATEAGLKAVTVFVAFCWALAITGLLNAAVGMVQVFMPGWTDAAWLSASSIAGRAVGNLRQPNHLSSVLMWGCIAVVALLELRRLALRWAAVVLALLVAAVVLTASRTGLVSVLLLALWALLDRRLHKSTRLLLLAAPLVYGAVWWGVAQWAGATEHSFGGAARLAETDISGSRFGIWANTLALIAQQPWAGVGWGEFNFAWTLTPFPGRPTAFFDHSHNLPLQLLVELGLPLGAAVLALLLWALWRAAAQAWAAPAVLPGGQADPGNHDWGVAQRCAVMVVLMIGLHSLLEYPLWYAYFLLPTAWAWGFALGAGQGWIRPQPQPLPQPQPQPRPQPQLQPQPQQRTGRSAPVGTTHHWMLTAGAVVLLSGTAYAALDYRRVASIFIVQPGALPLEQRVALGQQSLFFGHHADYAAATSGVLVADKAAAFDRATHFLLDTRLMTAWAQELAAQGRVDEARHLAQRLREFKKPGAEEFFAVCLVQAEQAKQPKVAKPAPFQCLPPQAPVDWRHYLPAD